MADEARQPLLPQTLSNDKTSGTRPNKLIVTLLVILITFLIITSVELALALHYKILVLLGDALVSYTDAGSYIVNIVAECMAKGKASTRKIVIIDVVASTVSLLFLVASTIFVTYEAMTTITLSSSRHVNVPVVLIVSCIGIIIDVAALAAVVCERGHSNLNIFSFLMHLAVDLLRGLAQVGVGVAILATKNLVNNSHIDAVGTLVHAGASVMAILTLLYVIVKDVRQKLLYNGHGNTE